MAVKVLLLNSKVHLEDLGQIPLWLNENNPLPAAQQLGAAYHFGGWQPFSGFTLKEGGILLYPGDPPLKPIALMRLGNELIYQYPHSWVAVIQPDRTFEVCRMD